ncbi:hypothetical protein HA402_013102 [Bradysia odoriphaga]|nr:hypothetical protein HA402_013102 [Bradysia odoriphaga]
MAFASNECQFGSEAIQTVYNRYELFRKTKAFDPDDAKVPLGHYSYLDKDGEERLAVEINGVYIMEFYKNDGDNKLLTKNGKYVVKDSVILNYMRDENGEFSFDDESNQKKFKSSLRSIDAAPPSDFEEDYKQVLVDLNAMRKKMFAYKNGLSREDFDRIELFQYTPSSVFDGFSVKYVEKEGSGFISFKYNGKDDISGEFWCGNESQKYDIVDGNLVANGEPNDQFN